MANSYHFKRLHKIFMPLEAAGYICESEEKAILSKNLIGYSGPFYRT